MRPTIFVSFSVCMMLAASQLHASTETHPLQPSAPRTVTVSEADTPPQIRAGLLQSTLIVLPSEEKVANVFAGDTVNWIFDGGHVASRFISVKPKTANAATDIHIVSDHGNEYTLALREVSDDSDPHFDSKVFIAPSDQAAKDRLAQLPVFVPVAELDKAKQEAVAAKAAQDAVLTPAESQLVDHIGNEVYASHYAERKAYRLILTCGTVMLLASLGMNLALARRPVANRYIRIDEMGRAQAIQYSDLNYSPREGEVRTYLTDWANYRYTVNRDVIAKKYPLNYYFLSQALASRLMGEDNANHLVSQVTAGQIEASDVQVQNVTITTMSEEMLQGARIARGTALMAVDRFYSAENSREPRTEHWLLSITYYLNPKQVSDQARVYPQYEFINPLGLTITEFHENRVSVDAHNPDAVAGATR